MCGIIGIVSKNQSVLPKLFQGLRNMEYRGYDSWGVCLKNDSLEHAKQPGKISKINFEELQENFSRSSLVGIAHTRWATTGVVSQANAHPQFSAQRKFAVVHNGIVENFDALKNELLQKGFLFRSETDTEVIAHLVEYYYEQCNDLLKSVQSTFKDLKGRNAFIVMCESENIIIGARKGSPLLVGYGENNHFIASDVMAFLEHTKDVSYLEDNEFVVINNSIKFYDYDGKLIEKNKRRVNWEYEQINLDGYDHYMFKEIMEQSHTFLDVLKQDPEVLKQAIIKIKNANKIAIIGSGTAGKVAYFGEYVFSTKVGRKLDFMISSEFNSYAELYEFGDVLLTVSQSGETADCLKAIEQAKAIGMTIISIVNVQGSSIDRMSDYSLYLQVGPEIAVASTKATTAQMLLLSLLAAGVNDQLEKFYADIDKLQENVELILQPTYLSSLRRVAQRMVDSKVIEIIGTGWQYPVALEGAIKILEVSYLLAMGLAARELKHYAISLIEPGTPVIVLGSVLPDEREAMLTTTLEVKARGAFVIGIDVVDNDFYDHFFPVPDVGEYISFPSLIILQLLAYFLSTEQGFNPDKPRNLAKSVTVV